MNGFSLRLENCWFSLLLLSRWLLLFYLGCSIFSLWLWKLRGFFWLLKLWLRCFLNWWDNNLLRNFYWLRHILRNLLLKSGLSSTEMDTCLLGNFFWSLFRLSLIVLAMFSLMVWSISTLTTSILIVSSFLLEITSTSVIISFERSFFR